MASSRLVLRDSPDHLICVACGTQYDVIADKDECQICDDPRQFVPPVGQKFTTLKTLRTNHKNVWWQDEREKRIWSVRTEPSFAIGNRAELIQTEHGNILWDLIPLLDEETIDKINELGGLKAIVISHPHYYSTWADWSMTFKCPVYVGEADQEWLERSKTTDAEIRFLTQKKTMIQIDGNDTGVMAVVVGGHFPGSLLLHWEKSLFIADTIVTVPSASNPVPGKPGVISYTFFWSIPNRIPMVPDDVLSIWRDVKGLDFDATYGAFEGMDIYTMDNEAERKTGGVKGRLLESCKIFIRGEGWTSHEMFEETL